MPYSAVSAPRTVVPKEEYTITVPKRKDTRIDMAKELMAAIDDYGIIGK